MALENSYSARRLDGHRRRAVVLRAAAGLGDEHARQRLGAADDRRDRPLEPHPVRQLHPRRPARPLGQLRELGGRRRLRHAGRGRPRRHRHGLHDRRRTRRSPSTTTTSPRRGPRPRSRPAARATGWCSRSLPAPRCRPTTTGSTCPTRSTPPATTPGSSTSTATSSTASSWATRPRRSSPNSRPFADASPCPSTRIEQSDGTFRADDMSGDGVAGGAFTTGFVVVPVRQHRLRPARLRREPAPAAARCPTAAWPSPYPGSPPRAIPTTAPAQSHARPQRRPEQPDFFQPGELQPRFDLSGDGKFEQSAFYAASQLAFNGPVVVVALPGLPVPQPDHRRSDAGQLRAGRPAGNSPADRRQRLGPVRHDAGLQRRVDPQAPERLAVRAEPGQRPPGPGHRRPTR